jgi:Glycosyl hydrolases family 25
MKTGADISHWQDSFDPRRYKAAGEDFIILKATQGRTFTDATFAGRWRAAGAAGLPRAAYHFGLPGESMAKQADHFISTLQAAGFRDGDAWALDMEVADGQRPSAIVSWSAAFCNRVRNALGGRGLFYTFPFFWGDFMGNPDSIPGNALGWWARYASSPYGGLSFAVRGWPDPPHVWQCTDGQDGCIKDVATIGRCDHNRMTDGAFAVLFQGADAGIAVLPEGEEDDMTVDEFVEQFTRPGSPVRTVLLSMARRGVNSTLGSGERIDVDDTGAGSPAREGVKQLADRALAPLLDDEAKVVAAINAVKGLVGSSRDAVLGALAAMDLNLTEEQIRSIAEQFDLDEMAVADAATFRLREVVERRP